MIKRSKSKLLISIQNKRINVFFLFLVISFVILILTKLSKTYTKTIQFDVIKNNVPDEYVVFNSEEPLKISLKTQGFSLLQYYIKKPLIEINFTDNIIKSDSFYVWTSSNAYSDLITQFDRNVEVLNINPDTLKFKYNVNASKIVPVKLNHKVAFIKGFDLIDDFKIEPDSIKVIGPESLVKNINMIHTDTLFLNNINKNIKTTIPLKLSDAENKFKFSKNQVVISAQVEKFTEGNLKVPIRVKNVPDDVVLKYFPKYVSVSFYTSLKNFKMVRKEDFIVECDYLKISENQPYLVPNVVKMPSRIKNVRIDQEQIDYIITE